MSEAQKPDDWCECYGCTTMRQPCIGAAQEIQDLDVQNVRLTKCLSEMGRK